MTTAKSLRDSGQSCRQIARTMGLASATTAVKYVRRAQDAGP
jgi:hypothetical protein